KDNVLSSAQTAEKDALNAFRVGEISYLEFLVFKQQLLEIRLREVNTEAAVRQAKINLKHSLGFKIK
ncbi:MAG: TolC family protein, partial [Candidatus Aminicenantes bacterium]|nr:TolC family protein [Candidatus Aminicenantes bacterium]